ncbi:hypothetical protein D9M70_615130 [compost metagenome]
MHAAAVHAHLGQQWPGQRAAHGEDQHRVAEAVATHLGAPAVQGAASGEQVHRAAGVLEAHVVAANHPRGQHERPGFMPARAGGGGDHQGG